MFSWLSPLCLLASPIIRAHYCLLHTHRFRNVLGNPPSFFFVFFRPRFGLVLVPFRVPLRPRRALVLHRPSESSSLIAACFALLFLQNWLAGPIVVVFFFVFILRKSFEGSCKGQEFVISGFLVSSWFPCDCLFRALQAIAR